MNESDQQLNNNKDDKGRVILLLLAMLPLPELTPTTTNYHPTPPLPIHTRTSHTAAHHAMSTLPTLPTLNPR